MVLGDTAIDAYIVMDCSNAVEMVPCLVHLHLKDVHRHLHTKWHIQEPVSAQCILKVVRYKDF